MTIINIKRRVELIYEILGGKQDMKFEHKIKIDDIGEENIKENIKKIFDCKENIRCIYQSYNKIYSFEYEDYIKENKIPLIVKLYLTQDDKSLEKIEIEMNCEEVTEYDLEFYYYKEIQQGLTEGVLHNDLKNYTIRVYYKILHDIGFKGEYIISGKYKIRFKPLFNEKQKNTISERIIAVDCEIEAKSVVQARSKAINVTKDFVAFLSVLINTGFYTLYSKFSHYITKDNIGLRSEFQRNAFYDSELGFLVMDNMNGLRHIEDYKEREPLQFFSYSAVESNNIGNSYFENNSSRVNMNMEKTFLEFKINKSRIQNEYREDIDCEAISSPIILIPRQIRKYYKGIHELEENKLKYFKNCSRLYNISMTCGADEPTLMLAYMVSAVECLAKTENKSFSEFMKNYSKDEYDKDFVDFLYGNLRSGHFHSGEMFFAEYNVNLDIMFESDFLRKREIYYKGRLCLRKVLIEWIKQNILREKENE